MNAEDDSRRRQAAIVQRAVQTMQRLVTDLLDRARVESGTFAIRSEPVDVADVIREAIDLSSVNGDRDRLLQVLSNLLDNALKFSGAGSTITARAAHSKAGVQVSIKDSGPGITP